MKDSFRNGFPYAKDGKMVCPSCTKYEGYPFGYEGDAKITSPVFLVIRKNKRTNESFLGCPNFPACKSSADVYSERVRKAKEKELYIDFEDELRPY